MKIGLLERLRLGNPFRVFRKDITKTGFLERLRRGETLVSDGAMGTTLQEKGLKPGENPAAWNLSHPRVVMAVLRGFVRAGSDVILTNSFRANGIALKEHGLEEKAGEINEAAAGIAVQAAAKSRRECHVLGSIGPTGKPVRIGKLREAGELPAKEAAKAFLEQAEALKRGGVEGFVIETMGSLDEAELAVRVVQQLGLPVVASMQFNPTLHAGLRTFYGETPEKSARRLDAAGADVIGANCGKMDDLVEAIRRMRGHTKKPLWVKANAGIPALEGGRNRYPDLPEQMAELAAVAAREGAQVIGGCCGTTPGHITMMRKAVAGSRRQGRQRAGRR